jgi:hypothetical protein
LKRPGDPRTYRVQALMKTKTPKVSDLTCHFKLMYLSISNFNATHLKYVLFATII